MNLLIRPDQVVPFDRGNGVVTIPYVGRWNAEDNRITTGQTVFAVGTGLPVHSHNVEESVLILEGLAIAEIDGERFDLVVSGRPGFRPGCRTDSSTAAMSRCGSTGCTAAARSLARSQPPVRPSSTFRRATGAG